ncbi:MAG TPA: ABC transporter permease [Candidatus Eisenbacteria bacterium]|nr:ABC transporter permease [Candidatus Eisenbacteria bacterium]
MFELAWQTVRRQPGRFVAAMGAVASAVMLVFVAGGLYLGLLEAMIRYPRSLPGEIVVAESGGSATMLHSSSHLSKDAAEALRKLPGVERAYELYGRLAWLERNGRQALVYLVGVGRRAEFGMPVRMVAGKARPEFDEIVIDEVLAHDLRVTIGDVLKVGVANLKIVGISSGGNAVLGTYAFVQRGTLVLGGIQEPSYVFVHVGTELGVDEVINRINQEDGMHAMTREAFRSANQALTRQIVLPLIAIVVGIACAVGGMVVALTLYNVTMERREEYGLMKALGLPDRAVLGAAFAQGGIATGVGVGAGLLIGWLLSAAVGMLEPRFVTTMPSWLTLGVAGGAVVVGAIASSIPARVVARIDPALVFRV